MSCHSPSESDGTDQTNAVERTDALERTDAVERTDALERTKARTNAVEQLKAAIKTGDYTDPLWNCVKEWQGVEFKTLGRGKAHTGSVPFTYELKVSSRTGLETSELIISTREKGKTITRSSVELALERYLELMAECGYVKGPKSAGQVFGASYLYAVFLAWKIIRDKPVEI